MLSVFICILWGIIWAACLIALAEILAWAATHVFKTAEIPARAIQLLRIIAFLLFLIYVVMCLQAHGTEWSIFPRVR